MIHIGAIDEVPDETYELLLLVLYTLEWSFGRFVEKC